MTAIILALATALFTVTLLSPAHAQAKHHTRKEAASARPLQINLHASAKKDCTPVDAPTVRVLQPPSSGTLTIRKGVMTTNRMAGCPGLKVPAQVVIYKSREGFVGQDQISYEVRNASGITNIYDVMIDVKPGPPSPLKRHGNQDI